MSSAEPDSVANQDIVNNVVEITGTSQAEAEHLLAACANNIEAAVALYFEQGPIQNADEIENPVATCTNIDEDGVRAPIAPVREQLIGPEDDNFFPDQSTLPTRISRASQRVKVCPFRDFAREGEIMEDELQAAESSLDTNGLSNASGSDDASGVRSRRRARASAMVAAAMDRKSRLDDLFRPPTDIAFIGSFQTARLRATELRHWLLVNVQSDSFDSQVLNRDVWSDKEVRKLIRREFMLWQIDADTSEGRRFIAFYHCNKLPYVCIIDPRTGEEVWKNDEPKQSNVLRDMRTFLLEHKDFNEEISNDPTTSKRSNEYITIDDDDDGDVSIESNTINKKKRAKIVELSEEEQIALAIRNSIRENGTRSVPSDDDGDNEVEEVDSELEEFAEENSKDNYKLNSFEKYLGSKTDELTMLKLRLINDENVEEVIQLRWPSNTQLKVLRLFITQKYPNIPKHGYKIICAFPRKTLASEQDSSSLKELSLHPSANLHVTLDD